MSADQQRLSPPLPPRPDEPLLGLDPPSSPQEELDTLRRVVTERLAAAVDDILGMFVDTVTRYREQIDLQRRQLDSLKPKEGPLLAPPWIKTCPDEQILSVRLEHADSSAETTSSAAHIKTEVSVEEFGASDPNFDPAGVSEGASGGRLLAEGSETDDSGDYWREAAGVWRPEEEAEGSCPSAKVQSSAEPPPALNCKVCGESFQRIGLLLTHASAHLRDCGLCGKHLDHGENLKLHLRGHRETSFRCGVCGQSFTLRGNLRTHMRIHSGERPFGCNVCGKSFGRRATLVRHVRSHTGEKPFVCAYCGRGFVEKGNLTVHLRTHTGERPYWCAACDRRFSQLSCYYKHPCQSRGPKS